MGATAADIAAGTRDARIVEWSDSAVQTAWPDARDGRTSPSPGGFDNASDAAAALSIKAALIGVVRGRFVQSAQDMIFISPADDGVPSWRLVDAEAGVDLTCMVARWELDADGESVTVECIG